MFTIGTTGVLTHNCRLRIDNRELETRGGGLFGSNPLTGSVGVVTINMPRIGYLSKNEKEFFERLETQFRQILREANLEQGARAIGGIEATANVMLAFAEGRMCQYVRSTFTKMPTDHWEDQWQGIKTGLFR